MRAWVGVRGWEQVGSPQECIQAAGSVQGGGERRGRGADEVAALGVRVRSSAHQSIVEQNSHAGL